MHHDGVVGRLGSLSKCVAEGEVVLVLREGGRAGGREGRREGGRDLSNGYRQLACKPLFILSPLSFSLRPFLPSFLPSLPAAKANTCTRPSCSKPPPRAPKKALWHPRVWSSRTEGLVEVWEEVTGHQDPQGRRARQKPRDRCARSCMSPPREGR